MFLTFNKRTALTKKELNVAVGQINFDARSTGIINTDLFPDLDITFRILEVNALEVNKSFGRVSVFGRAGLYDTRYPMNQAMKSRE